MDLEVLEKIKKFLKTKQPSHTVIFSILSLFLFFITINERNIKFKAILIIALFINFLWYLDKNIKKFFINTTLFLFLLFLNSNISLVIEYYCHNSIGTFFPLTFFIIITSYLIFEKSNKKYLLLFISSLHYSILMLALVYFNQINIYLFVVIATTQQIMCFLIKEWYNKNKMRL